jgi:hypothetical protein
MAGPPPSGVELPLRAGGVVDALEVVELLAQRAALVSQLASVLGRVAVDARAGERRRQGPGGCGRQHGQALQVQVRSLSRVVSHAGAPCLCGDPFAASPAASTSKALLPSALVC